MCEKSSLGRQTAPGVLSTEVALESVFLPPPDVPTCRIFQLQRSQCVFHVGQAPYQTIMEFHDDAIPIRGCRQCMMMISDCNAAYQPHQQACLAQDGIVINTTVFTSLSNKPLINKPQRLRMSGLVVQRL